MSKYEVWVTIWSEEHKKQIKVVAGEFDRYMNAKLFAEAYGAHYALSVSGAVYTRAAPFVWPPKLTGVKNRQIVAARSQAK